MERAAGGVVLAGLFQLHTTVDHVDNIDAGEKFINKALGYPAGHSGVYPQSVSKLLSSETRKAPVAWAIGALLYQRVCDESELGLHHLADLAHVGTALHFGFEDAHHFTHVLHACSTGLCNCI